MVVVPGGLTGFASEIAEKAHYSYEGSGILGSHCWGAWGHCWGAWGLLLMCTLPLSPRSIVPPAGQAFGVMRSVQKMNPELVEEARAPRGGTEEGDRRRWGTAWGRNCMLRSMKTTCHTAHNPATQCRASVGPV